MEREGDAKDVRIKVSFIPHCIQITGWNDAMVKGVIGNGYF